MPIDDDPVAIRAALWYQTDRRYQRAVERLSRARANAEVTVRPEDQSPDFSREPAERHLDPIVPWTVDRRAWEGRLRRYTAPFTRESGIYGASATFEATVETRWYVNSEGSELQTSQPIYRLHIAAFSKADDGMELPRYETFFAFTPGGLPSDSTVLRSVARIITDLHALRRAPVIDPYTGPAILSGRASAVFFHEVLGHRVEGHRQKDEDEGQTFKKKVNDPVLPTDFSVSFDPTIRKLGEVDLAGAYRFDDEGVRGRRVGVIERGLFQEFLMSRSPIEGFAHSNGHGRRQPGFPPVARQSNLIVTSTQPRSRAALKELLIEQIRRDRKPFGLFFDDIAGGFTLTGRDIPNAFNVLPVMVYRIFPDGREELVRGVDFIGTPLTTFSRITAADDRVEVFNGMCGAESGYIPVSAVSPGVFISQVEVQKKSKSQELPPILAAPADVAGQPRPDTGDIVVRAMRDELARSMSQLRLDTFPGPYFVAYRIDELEVHEASATLGSLVRSDAARDRRLTVELRVGDYTFDNSNFFGMPTGGFGDMGGFSWLGDPGALPLDDDYRELRRQLWLYTDLEYKGAIEQLAQKKAVLQGRAPRDYVPDFSQEPPLTSSDIGQWTPPDRGQAEGLVRRVSGLLRGQAEIQYSGVDWSAGRLRTWYVNSEGTSYVRSAPWTGVRLRGTTQAADGTPVADEVVIHRFAASSAPRAEDVADSVRMLARRLMVLREAPAAEAYHGPVLFEQQAAAELFGQAFAPHVTAERMPMSDNPMFESAMAGRGDDLLERLGARVLPRFLSVADDATLLAVDGVALESRRFDDDGVPTRAVTIVDRGVLKTLLTTRVPVGALRRSTGSRRGERPQVSNFVITADSGFTDAALRQRLLQLAAERGHGYGIVVRRLANPWSAVFRDPFMFLRSFGGPGGGNTTLLATTAFRLYPDGREVPVRNASVSDVTLGAFRDIVAASRTRTVHTTPVQGSSPIFRGRGPFSIRQVEEAATYVAPSVLFEELSVRPREGQTPRLPVMSHPSTPR